MAILAQLEDEPQSSERRGSSRRRLRLITRGSTASSSYTPVIIHDLSVSGLLIESLVEFSVGERLELQLPQMGAAEASIAWSSGRFFGCKLAQPISTAAVSAALLLSPSPSADEQDRDVIAVAVAELRNLSSKVTQITDQLERTIDHLNEKQGRPKRR